MRIVIDLDGVICPLKRAEESYADLTPVPGAAERLRGLRSSGHYIIICTARNMKTCNSNLGKVLKNVGQITLEWLARHGMEYDEIHFGKPNADVYIDDRAVRFTGWSDLTDAAITRFASTSETYER